MKRAGEVMLNTLTVAVGVATLFMTGVFVRREFFAPAIVVPGAEPPREVDGWQGIVSRGHRIGPKDASITIVQFSDFQCPYCKKFATNTLPRVLKQFAPHVAMVYRHWPLPSHRFAYPFARAAECAAAQGKFEAFHDRVFAQFDSIRTKTPVEFGREVKIPDMVAFRKCAESAEPVPGIEADIAEAKRIKAPGTPTLVINGWMLAGGADSATIDSVIYRLGSRPASQKFNR